MGQRLWIVHKFVASTEHGTASDFLGIFDTEEAAITHCIEWECWIGPCDLNRGLPLERSPCWPGAYYPQAVAAGVDVKNPEEVAS
jgi:hypothetical protein